MQFVLIDTDEDQGVIIAFRRDFFKVSLGTDSDFHANDYLEWVHVNSK